MRCSRFVAAALLSTAATTAFADTFTVYVFNREYSQNNPAQDPPPGLPDDPTISIGDTVHWVLLEGFHTVDGCSGGSETYSSGALFTVGQTFDHTFTHAGVFEYYCAFHGNDNGDGTAGGMAGMVTVIDGMPACIADIGVAGGIPGHDGALDNNDFIAFINFFFDQNPIADMGVAGGLPGQDGLFDNNDFIAFITHFFDGCQ